MPQKKLKLEAKLNRIYFKSLCIVIVTLLLSYMVFSYISIPDQNQQQLEENAQVLSDQFFNLKETNSDIQSAPFQDLYQEWKLNHSIAKVIFIQNSGTELILMDNGGATRFHSIQKSIAVDKNGTSDGKLEIQFYKNNMWDTLFHQWPQFFIALLAVTVFGIFILSSLKKHLLTPINDLMLGLEEVTKKFHRKPDSHMMVNEIGQITHSFFNLLNQIDSHEKELMRVNKELQQSSDALENQLLERQIAESKLQFISKHDLLTGLPNREKFSLKLNGLLEDSHLEGHTHALLYIDLDQFKVVNDTCGHIAGDELLLKVRDILKKELREEDFLSRLGGDEFGILLPYCNLSMALTIAQKIRISISEYKFTQGNHSFALSASMGLVPVSAEFDDPQILLSIADALCYTAKDHGRNCVELYQGKKQGFVNSQIEMQWIAKINHALDHDAIELMYQKIVPREKNLSPHYEIVIRLRDEQGVLIEPIEFLPAAERYNLMPRIDRYVIDRTFQWLQQNPQHLAKLKLCSINISGGSLNDSYFLQFVINKFKNYQIPPHKICFEITESMAVKAFHHTLKFIHELKTLGCKFALDDFGSGFSSYTYLKRLDVDYLKIDGSFVQHIDTDPVDYAMVKSINEIGHILNKKTIAEYVSSEEIEQKLAKLDVDYFQGYYYSKPELLMSSSVEVS